MRERIIKFRAWNFNMYRMDYFNLGDTVPYYYKDDVAVQYDVMQFTGLKDKNGKEIYEGDILKYKTVKMEVVYNEKYAKWVVQYHNIWKKIARVPSKFYKTLVWGAEKGEIIGNIYENPSLISPERTEKLK